MWCFEAICCIWSYIVAFRRVATATWVSAELLRGIQDTNFRKQSTDIITQVSARLRRCAHESGKEYKASLQHIYISCEESCSLAAEISGLICSELHRMPPMSKENNIRSRRTTGRQANGGGCKQLRNPVCNVITVRADRYHIRMPATLRLNSNHPSCFVPGLPDGLRGNAVHSLDSLTSSLVGMLRGSVCGYPIQHI